MRRGFRYRNDDSMSRPRYERRERVPTHYIKRRHSPGMIVQRRRSPQFMRRSPIHRHSPIRHRGYEMSPSPPVSLVDDEDDLPTFRSVVVRGIPHHLHDIDVKEDLYRVFRSFSNISVKLNIVMDDRHAFINFCSPQEAAIALRDFPVLRLFGRSLIVHPVLNSSYPHKTHRFEHNRSEQQHHHHHHRRNSLVERRGMSDFSVEENPECRVLFVGNLDDDVSAVELKKLFSRYAPVLDVDIKFPRDSFPFAFVKFANPDDANIAREALHGKPFFSNSLRIGYGKSKPTPCLWVGNLNRNTSLGLLEEEFDRFGVIKKIDYLKGSTFAYILFSNSDAACAAFSSMNGRSLRSGDRRLRLDFTDYELTLNMMQRRGPSRGLDRQLTPEYEAVFDRPLHRRQFRGEHLSEARAFRQNLLSRIGTRVKRGMPNRRGIGHLHHSRVVSDRRSPIGSSTIRRTPALSRKEHKRLSPETSTANSSINVHGSIRSLEDIPKTNPSKWKGFLVLKNSAFVSNFTVIDGNPKVCESLLYDINSQETASSLRITQRLRLDPGKLNEVNRRINNSGYDGYCILLATHVNLANNMSAPTGTHVRHLKHLVLYLKNKEAAGVTGLPVGAKDNQGVLHAFPPCEFSNKFLSKVLPDPTADSNEEYLLMVLVSGGT